MLIFQREITHGGRILYSEDLVGEALQVLYEKHGYKREDLFVQTK